jgi:hypothetical protein
MTGVVWWKRLVRRLGVIALTVGVIGIGVGTVRLAAQWRAEAAPLDVSPVSMDTIVEAAQIESDRATQLSAAVDEMAGQIGDLSAALSTADSNASSDEAHVQALQQQLDRTTAKLKSLQSQLRAGQERLTQLNAAAARQAALNAAARSSGGGGGGGGGASVGEEHGEDEPEDEDEPDDH